MQHLRLPLIFALLTNLFACQPHTHGPEETDHSHATGESNAQETDIIHLTATQLTSAGIEYGSFTPKDLGIGIPVNAQLVVHPEHRAQVAAFSDGILVELRATLNARVRKGQVLAVVRKPELLDIQQQFLENKDRLVFLQAEHERFAALKNADATAAKNFQKADAELRTAQTTIQVLAAKLRQYQIDPDQLRPDNLRTQLNLLAPANGTITVIHTGLGTAVQPGTPVCEVTDLSQLHADLWIFEKDLPQVKSGQSVSLFFPTDRTRHFQAVLYSIDKQLDQEKRAVRAHARLAGLSVGKDNFVEGAFLEAQIATENTGPVPALPESAVIREGEADFIYLFEKETNGETHFRKVLVQRGAAADGFVSVQPNEPLPTDAKIVVKGAYYVSAQGTSIEAEHAH